MPKGGLGKRGQPTLYKEEFVELAYRLALLGMTDEEMAPVFGISYAAMSKWDKAHPDFLQARARGREPADAEVAESLRKRALGYSHPAVKIFMPQGAAAPVYAEFTQHYPPDTMAGNIWLMNRQPKFWKPRRADDPGVDGATVTVRVIGGLPDD